MQDNTKRGEKTLFWMKVLFILFILGSFINPSLKQALEKTQQEMFALGIAYFVYCLIFVFAFLISAVTFVVYFFSWLHRAIANLRILTKPHFSPVGAIVLTLIPIIGFVFHFWIFNDMAGCQEKCMEERGLLKERFPRKFLVAWFLATLVFLVFGFMCSNSAVENVIDNLFFVASIGLYIKFLTFYVARERELFQYHTETLFQKRVDEAIRERDIERAVAQLRENKNKEVPKSEDTNSEQ